MNRFGFHGKILHINLKTRQTWLEEPDDQFWRIYGGCT